MAQNIAITDYHDRVQVLFENAQILRDNMKNFAATFNRPAEATQATPAQPTQPTQATTSPVETAKPTVNRGVDAQALAASINIPVPTKKQATETAAPAETQNEAAKVVAGIDIDALLAGTNLDKERADTPQIFV